MIKQLFGLILILLPFLGYGIYNSRGTHHGAIAVSMSTLEYGVSDHQKSRKEAAKAAIAACRAKGGDMPAADCEVGVWFYDACAALAIDPHSKKEKDGAWGGDWAGTKEVAQKRAMENCEQQSRRGKCKLVESFCSL